MAKLPEIGFHIRTVYTGEILTAAKVNEMVDGINRANAAISREASASSLPVAAVTAGLLMAGSTQRRVTRRGLLLLERLLGHGQA